MQILADRIEFCWIHLRGIGTLENSLWGYDGAGIRVWLNALNMESKPAVIGHGYGQGQGQGQRLGLDRRQRLGYEPLAYLPCVKHR